MPESPPASKQRRRAEIVSRAAPSAWSWRALPIVLLALLGLLGYLQYRWIGEVAVAERERLQTTLDRSADDFTNHFDRLVTDLFATLQYDARSRERGNRSDRRRQLDRVPPDPEKLVLERFDRWLGETSHPDLVEAVYLLSSGERASSRRLEGSAFRDAALPRPLSRLAKRLAEEPQRLPSRLPPTLGEPPAVIASLIMLGDRDRPRPRRVPATVTVALLDRDYLVDTLIPDLIERYFGGSSSAASEFDLRIVSTRSGAQIYPELDDANPPRDRQPDSVKEFFSPRRFGSGPPTPILAPSGGEWRLEIQHRAGSLEAVVAQTRRRNLLLSLGILSLLAAAMAVLMSSARRAQQLAQQQVDFVASVTHELNTPLAAIRSAGQNLADGVVVDPEKIGQYGSMILKEGHRLSTLVGQALDYAGMQGGSHQPYDQGACSLHDVIHQSIDNLEWLRQESGAEIETEIAPDLDPVLGDRTALIRMTDNLLTNAIKYGAPHGELGARVVVSAHNHDDHVVLTIADQGPGIPTEERSRVFEPFFRGTAARKGTISGSGLGLALVRHIVERHQGIISIESSDRGTHVEVLLPRSASGDGSPRARGREI